METKTFTKTSKRTREAMVNIPLSAFRYLSRYPREKKIVVEIAIADLKRVNSAETLDEIINEARLDYALGNYTTHKTAKSLMAALEAWYEGQSLAALYAGVSEIAAAYSGRFQRKNTNIY